jgi:hypothetical protein
MGSRRQDYGISRRVLSPGNAPAAEWWFDFECFNWRRAILIYPTKEQSNSILRVAGWIIANGIDAAGDFRAARDLLLMNRPRLPEKAVSDCSSRRGRCCTGLQTGGRAESLGTADSGTARYR